MARATLWMSVFVCGFVNLALEVVCPRIIATIYGSTLAGWAFGITTVLGGLALGYWLGGLVPPARFRPFLQLAILLGGLWAAACKRLCWGTAEWFGTHGTASIGGSTLVAIGPASVFFGMCPVLCLHGLLGAPERAAATASRVFALSTLGSILGGLAGAFLGVQRLGIDTTLASLAMISVLTAALLHRKRTAAVGLAAVLVVGGGGSDPVRKGMTRIESRESPWQNVQVLAQGETKVMAFGPESQTVWNPALRTGAPYLQVLTELARVRSIRRALVVGGAGNALGHMLEDLGCHVVVLELDPVVAELAERHFGQIRGKVLIGDGRLGLRSLGSESFDLVVVDAFCGPGVIPGHLLSVQALEEYRKRLRGSGLLAVNFHGAPSGDLAHGTVLVSETLRAVFPVVRMWPVVECSTRSTAWQNIWALATADRNFASGLEAPRGAVSPATDDLNPIEFVLHAASMRAFGRQDLDTIWDFAEKPR